MKVSVSLGLTIQINPEAREFARPSIEIAEIDVDGDVDVQLAKAKIAVLKVWDVASEVIYTKLVELTDGPQPTVRAALAGATKDVGKALEAVVIDRSALRGKGRADR